LGEAWAAGLKSLLDCRQFVNYAPVACIIKLLRITIVIDAPSTSKVMLQIVASLIDAARGVIYDRNMAIPHVYGTGVICDERQMTIIIVL